MLLFEKQFQSKTNMLEHQVSHIAEVKDIPFSKVPRNKGTVNTMINLKSTMKVLLKH